MGLVVCVKATPEYQAHHSVRQNYIINTCACPPPFWLELEPGLIRRLAQARLSGLSA